MSTQQSIVVALPSVVTVLLVDDNPADRELAHRAIERDLPSVQFLEPITDAQLQEHLAAPHFDVVVTDYRLGWSDGLQVLRQVKQQCDVPVIMFTNTGTEEVCAEGLRLGLFDYLIKRADQFARLPQVVRLALEMVAHKKSLLAQRSQLEASRAQLTVLLDSERRAHAEADAARIEAQRANQIKDEFLTTLSHELRTPLSAIVGWAHILLTKHDDQELIVRGLQTVLRNAKAQTKLIDDLLDMSRIISGQLRLELESVDISEVIKGPIESLQPMAQHAKVQIETQLEPALGKLRCDPQRVQQMIWNLLSNGIKFTPAGGAVRVQAQRLANEICITVSDTGIGIDADFLAHVFDRFRQADAGVRRSRGGMGLGLAIVKSLAELHDGRVEVHSAGVGQGARFTLHLPLWGFQATEVEQSVADLKAEQAKAVIKGVDVLLVDDDPDTLDLLRHVLQDAQAQVRSVDSVDAALQAIEQQVPQILISDLGMPDKDGYQLITNLRQLTPQQGGALPAAALSAFARSEDRQRALRAGFDCYAVKPIDPDELLSVAASLVKLGQRRQPVADAKRPTHSQPLHCGC